jgi:ATP-dependent RNA helicase DeaD
MTDTGKRNDVNDGQSAAANSQGFERLGLRADVEQALAGEESTAFRTMVAELSASYELAAIAAAAMAALHAAVYPGDPDQREIPSFVPPPAGADRGTRGLRHGCSDRFGDRGSRNGRGCVRERVSERDRSFALDRAPARAYGDDRGDRPARASKCNDDSPCERASRAPRAVPEEMVNLYVSVGREAGVRPSDLVGAIANEAGLRARYIGHIDIGERHSFVQVERTLVKQVMEALRRTIIRGRKVKVDIDRRLPRQ